MPHYRFLSCNGAMELRMLDDVADEPAGISISYARNRTDEPLVLALVPADSLVSIWFMNF
jgi:hypothetical protein